LGIELLLEWGGSRVPAMGNALATVGGVTILSVPYFMGDPMPGFEVPTPNHPVTPPLPDGTPQQRMAVLYHHLADEVAARDRPVVYAGDCVSIIGVLAGLSRRAIRPTLVFFDAHGDFNTWETTPSGFIGGMPLAMVIGRGEQTILDGTGLEPLADHRAVLVDGRDLDPGEDDALAASGVRTVSVDEIADGWAPDGPLHVHVDGDVVDPTEMPAMNYPAPGGPSLDAVAAAVAALHTTGRVEAFSISSWNPELPGAEIAAAAMQRIAAPFLG
jgi:arginase